MFSLFSLTSCQNKNRNETKSDECVMEEQEAKKLGIALVGLGKYSSEQLAPALKETKYCFLAV